MKSLQLPLRDDQIEELRSGDEVQLSGTILTGRDQACARLHQMLQEGETLPVELSGQLIYFVGPSPARPGEVVGSAGPTTSGRMNRFLPTLLAAGLRGVVGKGYLSQDAKDALVRHRGVYLGAIGGTGALLSRSIVEVRVVAFAELLSEALYLMRLDGLPAIVLNDCHGGDLYTEAIRGTGHA